MTDQILQEYVDDVAKTFSTYKKLSEKAIAQVDDEQFFHAIDAESNSIAIIVKHVGGNLRSRWTDFLTTDGEKPDRFRDAEFVSENDTRESLTQLWETGWSTLAATLESLEPADLERVVKIRNEDHSVVKAINRSLAHTASHAGQIIFLAKHLLSSDWKTISIPRNSSANFNAFMHETGIKENVDPLTLQENFKGDLEK